MTTEEVINILQNIDPQCQNDCPISRDDCAKQENKCLVSEALEYAVDFLSSDVVEVVTGAWKDNFPDGYKCSECGASVKSAVISNYSWNITGKMKFCPNCGVDMRDEKKYGKNQIL